MTEQCTYDGCTSAPYRKSIRGLCYIHDREKKRARAEAPQQAEWVEEFESGSLTRDQLMGKLERRAMGLEKVESQTAKGDPIEIDLTPAAMQSAARLLVRMRGWDEEPPIDNAGEMNDLGQRVREHLGWT